LNLHKVTIPDAAYIQLRCRTPENEQYDARNIEDFNKCIAYK